MCIQTYFTEDEVKEKLTTKLTDKELKEIRRITTIFRHRSFLIPVVDMLRMLNELEHYKKLAGE